jgi:hypothetical protein
VHDKVRANLDRIPVGIPEPMIVGRGIDDVAIVSLTLTPSEEAGKCGFANDLTRVARELRTELSKIDNVGLTYLVGRHRRDHPHCARSEAAGALRRHAAAARRQGQRRQPGLSGGRSDDQRQIGRVDGGRNALCTGRDRQFADHHP